MNEATLAWIKTINERCDEVGCIDRAEHQFRVEMGRFRMGALNSWYNREGYYHTENGYYGYVVAYDALGTTIWPCIIEEDIKYGNSRADNLINELHP